MIKNLLSVSYWFTLKPGAVHTSGQYMFAGIIIVYFLITIFIFLYNKKGKRSIYSKIFNKISSFTLTNAIIGVFLFFFAFEQLPFLSMRLWRLVWVLSMIFWLTFIFKNIAKIPKIKEEKSKENEYQKYIP